jgi:hypothetical protein
VIYIPLGWKLIGACKPAAFPRQKMELGLVIFHAELETKVHYSLGRLLPLIMTVKATG